MKRAVGGSSSVNTPPPLPWTLAVSIAGMLLFYSWYRLVRSYKGLNSGKFRVIHSFESKLPASSYDAEWVSVGEGKDPELYLPSEVQLLASSILTFGMPEACGQ